MKYTLLLYLAIVLSNCKEEPVSIGNYPEGIRIFDNESINDCSLPACSSDRIVRLKAKNVNGTILESIVSDNFLVSYTYTFDSYITFRFCNLPDEFKEDGLEVRFDGELLDPCGVYVRSWPEEETYILKITKISLR